MGDGPVDRPRLVGWKEIGQFLGVDARTAQRWERERGLPVARTDGERARISAYPEELERWRMADTVKPRPWASIKVLQVYGLSATLMLVIVCGILAMSYLHRRGVGPATNFRVDGHVLRVFDSAGRQLWEHTFEILPAPYQYAPDRIALNAAFTDLRGDGRREMLFLHWRYIANGPLSSTLVCFSETGRLLWQYTPSGQISDAQKTYAPNFVLDRFVVVPPRNRRPGLVVTTSHHSVSYPSQVTALDSDGKMIGQYWHSGHLYHLGLIDLEGKGTEDVLLGGINNGYHRATLIDLDPWHLAGASTQPPGDAHQLQSPIRGNERRVLLFPRTELNEIAEPFNSVIAMWEEGDTIQVTVREKRGDDGGYIAYSLDRRRLTLRSVTPSEGLAKIYDQYRVAKRLNRDLLRDEMPRLQQITYLGQLQK